MKRGESPRKSQTPCRNLVGLSAVFGLVVVVGVVAIDPGAAIDAATTRTLADFPSIPHSATEYDRCGELDSTIIGGQPVAPSYAAGMFANARTVSTTSTLRRVTGAPSGTLPAEMVIPAGTSATLINQWIAAAQTQDSSHTFFVSPGLTTLAGSLVIPPGRPGRKLTLAGLITTPTATVADSTHAVIEGVEVTGASRAASYSAIRGDATDVEIRHLEVRLFGDASKMRAIAGPNPTAAFMASSWVVDAANDVNNNGLNSLAAINTDGAVRWSGIRNWVHLNAGAGIRVGDFNNVWDSCLDQNGQYGVQSYFANDANVFTNEIRDNGLHFKYRLDQRLPMQDDGMSGGTKFWASRNIRTQANLVRNNHGPGVWYDTNNFDSFIYDNWIEANTREGIMYETSYNAVISDNYLKNNSTTRLPTDDVRTDSSLYISNSSGAQLYENVGGVAVPIQSPMTGRIVADNNFIEGNKWPITIFHRAGRFCSSELESSGGSAGAYYSGACTLTGARSSMSPVPTAVSSRVMSPLAQPRYTTGVNVQYGTGTSWWDCSDQTQWWSNREKTFERCAWNTNNVTVVNNKIALPASGAGPSYAAQNGGHIIQIASRATCGSTAPLQYCSFGLVGSKVVNGQPTRVAIKLTGKVRDATRAYEAWVPDDYFLRAMTTGPKANVIKNNEYLVSSGAGATTYTERGGDPGSGNCTNGTLSDPVSEVVNFGIWSGGAVMGDNRFCRLLITLQ